MWENKIVPARAGKRGSVSGCGQSSQATQTPGTLCSEVWNLIPLGWEGCCDSQADPLVEVG